MGPMRKLSPTSAVPPGYQGRDERQLQEIERRRKHHLAAGSRSRQRSQGGQTMSDSTVAQIFITSTVPASHKKTGG
jgi:hypothetical protein